MKRRSKVVIGGIGAILLGGWLLNGCLAAPRYRGPKSDHFDGKRFSNIGDFEERGFRDLLKWRITGDDTPWPEWIEDEPVDPPPAAVDEGWRVTFVNHATTLIQVPGANIITDPIFSERAGPFTWAGPKRHRAPGVSFDDLPKIDIVILSHNHYDHCDSRTLERLAKRDDPLFIAGLGTGKLFETFGVERSKDLDWWQNTTHSGVEITFTPAQHWATRGVGDQNGNLWGSYFLRAGDATFYFAGDSGWGPHFEMIAERLGHPDLALIPIGAYEPRWFMKPQHINPAEAVDAHLALGAKRSVGIHWGTFDLTDEPHDEPPRALARAMKAKGLPPDAFLALPNGGHVTHDE